MSTEKKPENEQDPLADLDGDNETDGPSEAVGSRGGVKGPSGAAGSRGS